MKHCSLLASFFNSHIAFNQSSQERLPQWIRHALCCTKCKQKTSTADIDYGIEEYKTGKTIQRRTSRLSYLCQALVRRSCAALSGCSLVLSCFRGNPIPKRRRVAAVQRLLSNHKIQNSVLSRYLNLLPQFQLTKSLYVKREKSRVRMGTGKIRSNGKLRMRNPRLIIRN